MKKSTNLNLCLRNLENKPLVCLRQRQKINRNIQNISHKLILAHFLCKKSCQSGEDSTLSGNVPETGD